MKYEEYSLIIITYFLEFLALLNGGFNYFLLVM